MFSGGARLGSIPLISLGGVPKNIPIDPFFSNVSLLLHGDGANNSTTITDSSSNNTVVTRVGNPVISTNQSISGSSSIYFPSISDYLTIGSSVFPSGTQNFTIEEFVYVTSSKTTITLLRSEGSGGIDIRIINNLGGLILEQTLVTTICSGVYSFALNSWHYVAATRNGNLFQIGVNGNIIASNTVSINFSNLPYRIGGNSGNSATNFVGYKDEIRVTNGVSRTISSIPGVPFYNV